jgi:hypothetical protein
MAVQGNLLGSSDLSRLVAAAQANRPPSLGQLAEARRKERLDTRTKLAELGLNYAFRNRQLDLQREQGESERKINQAKLDEKIRYNTEALKISRDDAQDKREQRRIDNKLQFFSIVGDYASTLNDLGQYPSQEQVEAFIARMPKEILDAVEYEKGDFKTGEGDGFGQENSDIKKQLENYRQQIKELQKNTALKKDLAQTSPKQNRRKRRQVRADINQSEKNISNLLSEERFLDRAKSNNKSIFGAEL